MTGFNLPPGCLESDLPGNTALDDLRWRLEEEVDAEWHREGVDELYCMMCDHCCVGCYQWSLFFDGKCWAVEAEVEKRMEDYR